MEQQRKTARARREQLLTLVNAWDPLDLLKAGAPRNEYHWLIDELFELLSRKPAQSDVAAFLDREIKERSGQIPRGASEFATRAVAWSQIED